MAFQHRPEHPFDFRTILKPVDHQLGVFKRCFNARLHRMQSAVGYIHIVGRCGLPHRRHGIITLQTPCSLHLAAIAGTSGNSKLCEPGVSITSKVVLDLNFSSMAAPI